MSSGNLLRSRTRRITLYVLASLGLYRFLFESFLFTGFLGDVTSRILNPMVFSLEVGATGVLAILLAWLTWAYQQKGVTLRHWMIPVAWGAIALPLALEFDTYRTDASISHAVLVAGLLAYALAGVLNRFPLVLPSLSSPSDPATNPVDSVGSLPERVRWQARGLPMVLLGAWGTLSLFVLPKIEGYTTGFEGAGVRLAGVSLPLLVAGAGLTSLLGSRMGPRTRVGLVWAGVPVLGLGVGLFAAWGLAGLMSDPGAVWFPLSVLSVAYGAWVAVLIQIRQAMETTNKRVGDSSTEKPGEPVPGKEGAT